MAKSCQKCSAPFEITDEDRKLLQKIAPRFNNIRYDLPDPAYCPACRRQRRLAWRNEWSLYRRTCDLTGKGIISVYNPESPFKVYESTAWYGDEWDPLEFGQEFDFNRPFFEQFREIQRKVPRMALAVLDNENSSYVNQSWHNKNCHLCFDIGYSQDMLYCYVTYHSRSVMDSTRGENLELCYSCVDCLNCYSSVMLQDCCNCSDSYFSFDCKNCKNVLLCSNLRNKEYYIANQEVTPENFKAVLEKLRLGSYSGYQSALKKFNSVRNGAIHKENHNVNCHECLGDYLSNSKNCKHSFESHEAEDCRYVTRVESKARDAIDVDHLAEIELAYNSTSVAGYRVIAGSLIIYGNSTFYCDSIHSSRDCFGCCGIKKKQYCILNKQYSAEEYEKLVPKIIQHMIQTKEWGEFFPPSFSPYGYNETTAIESFPLTKEEALATGFNWSDFAPPPPSATKTIQASILPDAIEDIPDDILNWAIICEKSGRPFKIIPQELAFYRKFRLPIPHRHPDVRHRDRESLRNQKIMHTRPCAKCGVNMQTTYAPEGPEKVYCETCYLSQVY